VLKIATNPTCRRLTKVIVIFKYARKTQFTVKIALPLRCTQNKESIDVRMNAVSSLFIKKLATSDFPTPISRLKMTIILSDAEPSVGGNYEFLTLRRGHDQFWLIHSRQFLTLRRAHYGGSYELPTLRRGHVYFLLIHSRQFLVFCRGRQVGLGSGQVRVGLSQI
jgi:hypothetical protein